MDKKVIFRVDAGQAQIFPLRSIEDGWFSCTKVDENLTIYIQVVYMPYDKDIDEKGIHGIFVTKQINNLSDIKKILAKEFNLKVDQVKLISAV